jgi:hypothetical protein
MRREPDEQRRGALVAVVLAGAWRAEPPPLALPPDDLAAVVPLLAQSSASSLAWRRLEAARLHTGRSTRPLQRTYRIDAIESAGHEDRLRIALRVLRAAGVEPVLIKGWSVARLYPEPGVRPYCDLDLAVAPDRLADAMAAIGPAAREYDIALDLHRAIPHLKDRTWDDAYRRSRLARLGDVDVRVLCPEDQLRLLCFHLMGHGCAAPLWLCDVGAVVESRGADFDWDYCLHGRRAWADWVVCWVGLACRLLGARLDEPSLAARTDDLPRWLAPTVLARWARPVRDWRLLDPIKSAYRRRLRPYHSLRLTQFLGLAGRVPEIPSALWRHYLRRRRPGGRDFEVHVESGA